MGGQGTLRVSCLFSSCHEFTPVHGAQFSHQGSTGAGSLMLVLESPERPPTRPASPLVRMCASECVSVSAYMRQLCHTQM